MTIMMAADTEPFVAIDAYEDPGMHAFKIDYICKSVPLFEPLSCILESATALSDQGWLMPITYNKLAGEVDITPE